MRSPTSCAAASRDTGGDAGTSPVSGSRAALSLTCPEGRAEALRAVLSYGESTPSRPRVRGGAKVVAAFGWPPRDPRVVPIDYNSLMKHDNPDLACVCPACRSPALQRRATKQPQFRCACGAEFDQPSVRPSMTGISRCTHCRAEGKNGFMLTRSAQRRLQRLVNEFGAAWILDTLGDGIRPWLERHVPSH